VNLVQPLAGGAAVLVRAGSPINKLIGAGFDGPIDAAQLAGIEADWHAHGEPMRVELASLASAAAAEQLGARGWMTAWRCCAARRPWRRRVGAGSRRRC